MAIIPQASGPSLSSRVANVEARVASAEATVAAAVAQVAAPNDSVVTATGSTTARALKDWTADVDRVTGEVEGYRPTFILSLEQRVRSGGIGSRPAGGVAISGPLYVGDRRNVWRYTEDVGNASLYTSDGSITKDTATTVTWNGITLTRVSGAGFYATLNSQIEGNALTPFTTGKKYLLSFYAKSLLGEAFIWHRYVNGSSDFGHGSSLIDSQVRRIRFFAQATSTSRLDLIVDPAVAPGSGTGANVIRWVFPGYTSASGDTATSPWDAVVGGFQIEEAPDDTKFGVAVIGDSTTAGSSASKDAPASREWTRWAEAILNVPFFNRGTGGYTCAQLDATWATKMTPLAANAKYAVIQCGVNDMIQGLSLATVQAGINSMVAKAIADGMLPVVATVTPADTTVNDATRQEVNAWIRVTFPRVLDFDAIVRSPSDPARLRPDWRGDGIHFGSAAKRAIGDYVARQGFWDFATPSPYQKLTAGTFTADGAVLSGASLSNATFTTGYSQKRVVLTYVPAGAVVLDASLGNYFEVTATSSSWFTLNAPTNPAAGQRITVRAVNAIGGGTALTWNFATGYKRAANATIADGYSRSIDFVYDGTTWFEVSRTPADVPN